jgi:hypothetical protein
LISPEKFNGKNLSDMSIAEVQAFQAARNKQSAGSSAVGKYQFMPDTLEMYVKKLKWLLNLYINSNVSYLGNGCKRIYWQILV